MSILVKRICTPVYTYLYIYIYMCIYNYSNTQNIPIAQFVCFRYVSLGTPIENDAQKCNNRILKDI